MRRWVFRIFVSIAILIVVVIAVVQIVLWTPLPRRIVMQQIEKSLGLRISADHLSVSWLGKSQLQNVSLGLPLSTGDFLKVKTLSIRHNSLLGLVLGRAVTVDSIEIDDPVVEVIQDAQGQWNLQQVLELLAKAGGSNSAQQSTAGPAEIPKLPSIKLVNGSVHVSDNQKHTLLLEPLNITGQPDGTLIWKYDLSIADSIVLQGQLAPGGNWQHRVTLGIQNLDPLLKGWGVPTTCSAVVKANWTGQFSDGKLTGTLSMEQVGAKAVPTLGDVRVDGSVDVQSAGSVLTLHPNKLNLTTTYVVLPNLGIQSGSIVSDANGLHAQSVKLAALGGVANLDAGFDPRTESVDLKATWSGLSLAKKTSQSGSLTASLRQPFIGRPVIKVELHDAGTLGDTTSDAVSVANRWNADLTLTGQGNSWKTIDWILSVPQLTYTTGSQTVDLSNTSAHVSQRLPLVELTDLSLPVDNLTHRPNAANFISSGRLDFNTAKWNFDATGGFDPTYQDAPVPITLALHANGNKDRYDLKNLTIAVSDVTLTADGSYDTLKPEHDKPVNLHLQLTQQPRIAPHAPIQGELAGDFSIVGVLFNDAGHFRPYLTTTGDLRSSDLVLLQRPIGDIDIKLRGTTSSPKISETEYGPVRTELTTTDFFLFQAPWSFSANYPDHDNRLQATLETRRLPVSEIARVAKVEGISGQLADAKWTVKISSPSLSGVDLQSEYHLIKPAAAGLSADTIDAAFTLHDGVLQLNPLLARSGNGTITTTASVDLKDPRHLISETTVDHWPYPISDSVVAQTSAHNIVDIDLHSKKMGASGTLTASTDVLFGSAKLAHMQIDGLIQNRTIAITRCKGNLLTGTLDASAAVDLDKPLAATGRVIGKNVDGAALAQVFPALNGAGGSYSFALTLAPALDPRPLEPVRFDLYLAAVDGHFRSLKIGGDRLLAMRAVGYLNTDRAVLDHSDLFLAGGVMHLWARADGRRGAGISTQTSIDFENLQLDQLAHVDPKMKQPMPGVLSGHIGMVRSGPHANQLLGSAHVDLVHTDLANFGPLTVLYNLMNAAGGISQKPNGSGSVDVTFEQNIARVNRFEFFNRGIDAHGLFTVGPINYDNVEKTYQSGQVVGAYRALKGTRLPVLSDFDTVFTALAGQLTTVNTFGSIGAAQYKQATLSDIGASMRELLVGDARAENPQ